MIVTFISEKQIPARKSSLWLDDVKLEPGINEVDEKIKNHPDFPLLVEQGAIVLEACDVKFVKKIEDTTVEIEETRSGDFEEKPKRNRKQV